jgi:hypothetical protein
MANLILLASNYVNIDFFSFVEFCTFFIGLCISKTFCFPRYVGYLSLLKFDASLLEALVLYYALSF